MKIVRNHIFEKFTEDSDPITDMGIGQIHIIKKFIDSIDLIERHKTPENWLWICARENKLDFVKYLIDEKRYDIHYKEDLPLRWAVYNGHLDICKFLISRGADVFAYNDGIFTLAGGNKAVETLIEKERKKIRSKGLRENENINEKFNEDSDPIYDMGIGMKHEIDKWIKTLPDKYSSPLSAAAEYGNLDFVKYLVQHGANINAYDYYALKEAIRKGHLPVVKYLIETDRWFVNDHDSMKDAIFIANYHNHIDIKRYLTKLFKK